jgi:hypothetical protein
MEGVVIERDVVVKWFCGEVKWRCGGDVKWCCGGDVVVM